MMNQRGTGVAGFQNCQPLQSANDTRIEKWLSGKDQISCTVRKTRSEGEAEAVKSFKILERSKVVPWKSVLSSSGASKKHECDAPLSSQQTKMEEGFS